MGFIQIIECHTDRYDELAALEEEWLAATEGRRTLRRTLVGRDRNDPRRHLVIAFFDSYESAMQNSSLPETGEFAGKQQALMDGPVRFHDLDVVEDRTV